MGIITYFYVFQLESNIRQKILIRPYFLKIINLGKITNLIERNLISFFPDLSSDYPVLFPVFLKINQTER